MLIIVTKIAHTLTQAWAAQQRRRRERRAAAELHCLSDYSLRDLGVSRSQIDERVRYPARHSASRGISEFI